MYNELQVIKELLGEYLFTTNLFVLTASRQILNSLSLGF